MQAQRYFGPDVILHTPGYLLRVLTECWPGITYSGINLYKLASDEYFEFLELIQEEEEEEEEEEIVQFAKHLFGASDIPNAKSLLQSQKTVFCHVE